MFIVFFDVLETILAGGIFVYGVFIFLYIQKTKYHKFKADHLHMTKVKMILALLFVFAKIRWMAYYLDVMLPIDNAVWFFIKISFLLVMLYSFYHVKKETDYFIK